MFADTINLAIGGNPSVAFVRVNQDKYSAEYRHRWEGGLYRLTLRHATFVDKTRGGIQRDRHNVELICELAPTTEFPYVRSAKAYTVFEYDVGRFPEATTKEVTAGLAGFFSSGNLDKLLNWES